MSVSAATALVQKKFAHVCRKNANWSAPWWARFRRDHNLSNREGRMAPATVAEAGGFRARVLSAFQDCRRAVRTATHHLRAQAHLHDHGLDNIPPSHVLQMDEVCVFVGVPGTKSGRTREKLMLRRGKSAVANDSHALPKPNGVSRETATLLLISNLDASFVGCWLIFNGKDRTQRWDRGDDTLRREPVLVHVSGKKSGTLPTDLLPQVFDSVLSMRRRGVPAVIILDRASVHNDPHSPALLRLHDNSQTVYLPAKSTGYLQPHDLSANFVFRLKLQQALKAHPTFRIDRPAVLDEVSRALLAKEGVVIPDTPPAPLPAPTTPKAARSAFVQCVERVIQDMKSCKRAFRAGWTRSGLAVALGYSHIPRTVYVNSHCSVSTSEAQYAGGGPTVPAVDEPNLVRRDQVRISTLHVRYHVHDEANNNHNDNEFFTTVLNTDVAYHHCMDDCKRPHPDIGTAATTADQKEADRRAQQLFYNSNLIAQRLQHGHRTQPRARGVRWPKHRGSHRHRRRRRAARGTTAGCCRCCCGCVVNVSRRAEGRYAFAAGVGADAARRRRSVTPTAGRSSRPPYEGEDCADPPRSRGW